MSQNLYWRPVADASILPDALKRVLRKEWFQSGSECRVDHHDTEFLRGLRAAGVEGADELLTLIEERGEIIVELMS